VAETSELAVGSVLAGQFRILARLGAGGMGELYLADQFAVDRKVAIKIIHSGLAQLHPSMLERFKREARSLAQLSHPNVVHLYAFGETEQGHPFLAMEFVPGDTLDTVLAKRPMSIERALTIALQIAHALSETHRRDVVHRDLKPANIMLKPAADGRDIVKLVDFGIAKAIDESGKLTQPGALFGTPQYMPPEQARGLTVDGRSDIYALGLVLYEMLAGSGPFPAKTPYDFIAQHLSARPEPPSRKRRHLPARVDALVLRCLEKAPEDRYPTADALALDLELALQEAQGKAVPPLKLVASQPEPVSTDIDDDHEAAVSGEREAVDAREAQASTTKHKLAWGRRGFRWLLWAAWIAMLAFFLPRGVFSSLLTEIAKLTSSKETSVSTAARPESGTPWVAYAGAALVSESSAIAGFTSHCLNRFTGRAADSLARYSSSVDLAAGPAASKAGVRGVYTLADPSTCIGHIRQAQLAAPEPFRRPAEVYSAALSELAAQLSAADAYYESEAYKDDGLQKGQAMHAPLMRAFDAYFAADRPLRALISERLENTSGSTVALDRVRVAARHLVLLASGAGRDLARIDPGAYESELDAFTKAAEEFAQSPSGACTSASSIQVFARPFSISAKQLQRALRTKAKSGKERDGDWLGPARPGTPASVVEKGNAVLRAYNNCTMARGEPVELEVVRLPARIGAP